LTIRIFALIALVVLVLGAPASARTDDLASPTATVERLNDALIDVMRNAKTLGYGGRFTRLAPILRETFNFRIMAGISVGRYWRKLNAAQRDRLATSFGDMSIATFAARFDGYSGEHFEIVGEEPARRKAVLVRNRLIKSNGEAVEINYLLKRSNSSWRAVDIYLDAKYSELAIKRSEYSSVIAKDGLDGLIRRIQAKLDELANKG